MLLSSSGRTFTTVTMETRGGGGRKRSFSDNKRDDSQRRKWAAALLIPPMRGRALETHAEHVRPHRLCIPSERGRWSVPGLGPESLSGVGWKCWERCNVSEFTVQDGGPAVNQIRAHANRVLTS